MEVRTHKLDKGTVNVFGNVSDVMLYWYIALYVIIWWFDRAFIAVQLAQLAFPLLPLTVVHFAVVAFLETPWANRVQAAFRFGFCTADRYLISPDPNPLLHVIPRVSPATSGRETPSSTPKQARA